MIYSEIFIRSLVKIGVSIKKLQVLSNALQRWIEVYSITKINKELQV